MRETAFECVRCRFFLLFSFPFFLLSMLFPMTVVPFNLHKPCANARWLSSLLFTLLLNFHFLGRFLIDIITFAYFLFYINMCSFFSWCSFVFFFFFFSFSVHIFVHLSKWKNYTNLWLGSLVCEYLKLLAVEGHSERDTIKFVHKLVYILSTVYSFDWTRFRPLSSSPISLTRLALNYRAFGCKWKRAFLVLFFLSSSLCCCRVA